MPDEFGYGSERIARRVVEIIKSEKVLGVDDIKDARRFMNPKGNPRAGDGDGLGERGTGYKLTDQRWHGGGNNDAVIGIIIDGGGSAITTGIKGDLAVTFNCTINSVELLADQTGSIVVDLWKSNYANYPPVVGNSLIVSGTKPTITADIKSQDTTLAGWTKQLAVGDIIRYNVDSASTLTRCLVSLKVTKT